MLFLPIVLLAITSAVECLLASRAYFVLAEITLGGAAETAFLNQVSILSTFLGCF
jgi:hypothetical protein